MRLCNGGTNQNCTSASATVAVPAVGAGLAGQPEPSTESLDESSTETLTEPSSESSTTDTGTTDTGTTDTGTTDTE